MAGYKQPCLQCGQLIDRDNNFCPICGTMHPFGYLCPACLREIAKNMAVCPGCGRQLYIPCPTCGQRTFVQDRCESCGASMMIRCKNSRCGAPQFFQNTVCTACGKKIKK